MRYFFILLIIVSSAYSEISIKSLMKTTKSSYYQTITPQEFASAVELLSKLLSDNAYDELDSLGLRVDYLKNIGVVIYDTQRRGWGFYIIKENGNNMISIPHRFFDVGTGSIGYRLIKKYPYRAIAFNSIHRKVKDMAHTHYTLFNAFHLAFAKAYPKSNIYQLHGFSSKYRKTREAKSAYAIVSSTSIPTRKVERIAECIDKNDYKTLLFGRDTDELGGTTNAQSKLLFDIEYRGFIHIELSRVFRDALRKDRDLLEKLHLCIP